MSLIEQLRHARRVSVPLVAVQTPDPAATMQTIAASDLNGKPPPIVAWDIVRGCRPINLAGKEVAAIDGEDSIGNPVAFLEAAVKFPPRTIAFVCNAQECMDAPVFRQGVWNLRDQFRRMLVLLAPSLELPPSLKDDVVMFDVRRVPRLGQEQPQVSRRGDGRPGGRRNAGPLSVRCRASCGHVPAPRRDRSRPPLGEQAAADRADAGPVGLAGR